VRWAAAGALAVVLALSIGAATATAVRAADSGCYADSVDRALQALRDTRGDDRAAARRAADGLEACTGQSQREILAELRQDPPDIADARDRLAALSRAARSPAFAPEPAKAHSAVDDILAQPRYAALRQDPSLGDRIRDALLRAAIWLLERIGGVVSSGFGIVLVLAAAAGLALVTFVIVRSSRWRGRPEARAGGGVGGPGGAGTSPDRFADADRLAAAGDLDGAVRALAGAVAAALADDRAWTMSPLTVRELFARSSDPATLRPLLLAFEAAVYGERPPDPDAYRGADAAAAPYRPARRAA